MLCPPGVPTRAQIYGAQGDENRETGLIEEWLLREPDPQWDMQLKKRVQAEPNLTVLSDVSLVTAERDGTYLRAVAGRDASGGQTLVRAALFADCGGALACAAYPALPPDVDDWTGAVAYGSYRLLGTSAYALYAIPGRWLCAQEYDNLFLAGGSLRLPHEAGEATAAIVGQAVGTAAAIAVKYGETAVGVVEHHREEWQQTLLYDDCFLPYCHRMVSEAALQAQLSCDDTISGDILNLRSGIDRNNAVWGEGDQGFTMGIGASVEYTMEEPVEVSRVRVVFDSDLSRNGGASDAPPKTLAKVFAIEIETEDGWDGLLFDTENVRRLITLPVCRAVTGIRLTVMETWGAPDVHMLSFDFE